MSGSCGRAKHIPPSNACVACSGARPKKLRACAWGLQLVAAQGLRALVELFSSERRSTAEVRLRADL